MLSWFAAAQPVVVGVVLLWAAVFKLTSPAARHAAQQSALRRLVGNERVLPAFRVIGVVEVLLGLALLAPLPAAPVAASVWTAGLLGYLTWARIAAPESSCGCLSDRHVPASTRSIVRGVLLLAASVLGAATPDWWASAAGHAPALVASVVVVELLAVAALSPELDERWLLPLRRWRVRRAHPLRDEADEFAVPVESSVQQLTRSPAYRSVADALRSDLLESWDEDEWRILTYAAQTGDGPATAVFAVPRLRYQPEDVRVALVP